MASAGKVSPVVIGAWNSAVSYTRLDIVSNATNTRSYIARKDSINVPLENTEYWQILADVADEATKVSYDNTTSGMTAKTVQEAIDELSAKEIETDPAMSGTSTNPVQNKVIKEYVDTADRVIKKQITTNLLKPTLQSQTINGVTCTNNGDGTFTLNTVDKASDITYFVITSEQKLNKGTYKMTGVGKDSAKDYYMYTLDHKLTSDSLRDGVGTITEDNYKQAIYIRISKDAVIHNDVIKPMITTDLDADYDSFISYTGDTGSLNGDVAQLHKKGWEWIGEVIGFNSVTIDISKYSEFYVEQRYSAVAHAIDRHFISSLLTDGGYNYMLRGSESEITNVIASKTQIKNQEFTDSSGANVTDSTVMIVYGKR